MLWLTVWRMGEGFTRASQPRCRLCALQQEGPWPFQYPAPVSTTHRRVQQPQQVLLIGVQESDLRPAGPPNQVGAQSQAEQSQQPHPKGGQQAWALWGEEAA